MCLVAEDPDATEGETIVGALVIWLIVDEAHIATIAVHPNYRHRGIGRRLLVEGLLQAAGRGAVKSLLEVRSGNLEHSTFISALVIRSLAYAPIIIKLKLRTPSYWIWILWTWNS